MGKAVRIFYVFLSAYLVLHGTFPGAVSSPTPFSFWSSDLSSSTTTGDLEQDAATNTSFSPVEADLAFGNDELCHPSCDCLDTYFNCRRRNLTELPLDLPNWVETL